MSTTTSTMTPLLVSLPLCLSLLACDPADDGEDDGAEVTATDGAEGGTLDPGDGDDDDDDDDENGDDDTGDGNGDGDGPSFARDIAPILDVSCSCHVGGAGGLTLGTGAYEALVGAPSSAGLSYVEPDDVDASYLIHKLRGTQGSVDGGGGGSMPVGGSLSDAELETVERWVEAGAPE